MIRTYAEVLLYIMAGHFFKCLIMFSISEVSKYERADTPKCALTSLYIILTQFKVTLCKIAVN